MSAEKGPKHIYAEEHQLCYYYYNFEEHLVQKQEHFATSEMRMTRWLRPAGSNMLEPTKMFIRAQIIRHNARQSYNNRLFIISFAFGFGQYRRMSCPSIFSQSEHVSY